MLEWAEGNEPHGRFGADVPRSRRARAQGRPGSLAPLRREALTTDVGELLRGPSRFVWSARRRAVRYVCCAADLVRSRSCSPNDGFESSPITSTVVVEMTPISWI